MSETPTDIDDVAAAAKLDTAPVERDEPVEQDELGTRQRGGRSTATSVLGWLRWAWYSLTSMRTALILLFLLALAAVPGSVLPQHASNPLRVRQYYVAHPTLAPDHQRDRRLRRFRLAVVRRGLLVAVHLPRRLRHPSQPPTPSRDACPAAGCATQPRPGCRISRVGRRKCPPATVVTASYGLLRSKRFRVDARIDERRCGEGAPARDRQPGVPPVAARGVGGHRGVVELRLHRHRARDGAHRVL